MIKKIMSLSIVFLILLFNSSCSRSTGVNNNDSEKSTPGHSTIPTETKEIPQSSMPTESNTNQYHPIISINYFREEAYSSAIILGGSHEGEFFTYNEYTENNMNSGTDLIYNDEKFRCYGSEGFITETNCYDSKIEYGDHLYEPMIKLGYFKTESHLPIIGIDCDWEVVPRTPTYIHDNELYLDYDGDGVDERIIAKSMGEIINEHGVKQNQKTISLMRNDYIICELDLALYEEETFWYYFLDLNGDSTLEVILMRQTPNEYFFNVYEIAKNKFICIFEYSGGD
ncbi:MAG: hypothetical protein ACOYIF_10025 [Acetivibrionales bacterium]